MGFPSIPGVTYTSLKTTRYLLDYGPSIYETDIATVNPPVITPPYEDNPLNGPIYPSFVPKTDSDGNDIARVRLSDVTVPLTGWALRSGVWANDGCEAAGQYIPFARTEAERVASGDPRPSIEERYPSFGQYYSAVIRALDDMVKDRLLLCEDWRPHFRSPTGAQDAKKRHKQLLTSSSAVPKESEACVANPPRSILIGELSKRRRPPRPRRAVFSQGRKSVLVVLFVPSVERDGRTAIDQNQWVDAALEMFGRVFGGATAYPKAKGTWRDDERGGALVKDEPVVVHCYTTPADIEDSGNLAELGSFCRKIGREGGQGEIGLVIGDEYFAIRDFTEE